MIRRKTIYCSHIIYVYRLLPYNCFRISIIKSLFEQATNWHEGERTTECAKVLGSFFLHFSKAKLIARHGFKDSHAKSNDKELQFRLVEGKRNGSRINSLWQKSMIN